MFICYLQIRILEYSKFIFLTYMTPPPCTLIHTEDKQTHPSHIYTQTHTMKALFLNGSFLQVLQNTYLTKNITGFNPPKIKTYINLNKANILICYSVCNAFLIRISMYFPFIVNMEAKEISSRIPEHTVILK